MITLRYIYIYIKILFALFNIYYTVKLCDKLFMELATNCALTSDCSEPCKFFLYGATYYTRLLKLNAQGNKRTKKKNMPEASLCAFLNSHVHLRTGLIDYLNSQYSAKLFFRTGVHIIHNTYTANKTTHNKYT